MCNCKKLVGFTKLDQSHSSLGKTIGKWISSGYKVKKVFIKDLKTSKCNCKKED